MAKVEYIRLRPRAGESIYNVAQEAIDFAAIYGCFCYFRFNGKEFTVTEDETEEEIVKEYYDKLNLT